MYLGGLSEKQKDMFLDLGIYLAKADGEFSKEEHAAFDELCAEMGINSRYEPAVSFEEALSYFVKETSRKTRNIVFFELLGIAMADEFFDKSEKTTIDKLALAFEINHDEVANLTESIGKLYGIYKEINCFINS